MVILSMMILMVMIWYDGNVSDDVVCYVSDGIDGDVSDVVDGNVSDGIDVDVSDVVR